MSVGRSAGLMCAVSLGLAAAAAAALAAVVGGGHDADGQPALAADPAEGGMRLDLAGAGSLRRRAPTSCSSCSRMGPGAPPTWTRGRGGVLCMWLRGPGASAPGGRRCLVSRAKAKSGLGLRYTVLDGAGRVTGSARQIRGDRGACELRPAPRLGALPLARRRRPDRPQRGPAARHRGVASRIASTTSPLARRRCFGAAARDRRRSCHDPRLRRAVIPAPEDAIVAQVRTVVARFAVGVQVRPGRARWRPASAASPPPGASCRDR
jgi:hypothetical protein